jgi:hypothetical protein
MYLYFLLVIASLLLVNFAYAICPVCIVAIGAGVGIAEKYGVDDTIVGLWSGALIVAMAWWTVNWLINKNWKFRGMGSIVFVAYYLLTIVPLYYAGLIGKISNKFWGIDKLFLGIIIGGILFYAGESLHFYLKSKNNNKVYFYFQRVIIPVIVLILASVVFYFLTK